MGLWNSINRIGITNIAEDFDHISRIKDRERRDNKENEASKGKGTNCP